MLNICILSIVLKLSHSGNNSEVIDQVATDSAKEPTCLTNQIEDEEEMMEGIKNSKIAKFKISVNLWIFRYSRLYDRKWSDKII